MSIRERWPTLTARERDAEVAKAKGWIKLEGPTHPELEARGGLWRMSNGHTCTLPPYSTSWADAGPLLEELTSGGELAYIGPDRRAGRWLVKIGDEWVDGETPPDAIALAYCLAKESGD